MTYDLIILGGGPAGYNAAERAAHGGMQVLLLEERALGGVCLNEGCIPTKTLLNSAKIYESALHGADYGVTVTGAAIDHTKVVDRKNKVVKTLVSGVGAKMRGARVTVKNGFGCITGKGPEGLRIRCEEEEYLAKKLLVCTGSEAAVPPIEGLREAVTVGFAMTNREILDMRTVPEKLCVIGGGVIGLEMASYFSTLGTQVTVVEMLDKIAGPTDKDISAVLQKNLEKKGIRFLMQARVTSVCGDKKTITCEADGAPVSIDCDRVLVSTGRRPRTTGIGLEKAGVLLDRGAIVCDERGRTSVPGIWAAGDVNGRSMLAHTAYREGEVAVSDMLGISDRVDYLAIPAAIYTKPEVGTVGDTIESAARRGVSATEHTVSLRYSGRYVAEVEGGDGIVKIVVDDAHKTVIGVHMIGSYASEIIYGAAAIVAARQRVCDVQKLVFPHPTVCEVIREGMFMID